MQDRRDRGGWGKSGPGKQWDAISIPDLRDKGKKVLLEPLAEQELWKRGSCMETVSKYGRSWWG